MTDVTLCLDLRIINPYVLNFSGGGGGGGMERKTCIYISFLQIDMTQVAETLPRVRQ